MGFSGIVRIVKSSRSPRGWIHNGDVFKFKNGHIVDLMIYDGKIHAHDMEIFSFFYDSFDYFCNLCEVEAVMKYDQEKFKNELME